jgi:hypothetical protein
MDGTLGHAVYQKRTHMDLYLHTKWVQHLTQKGAVLAMLVWGAGMLCGAGSLREELQYDRKVFKRNGYSVSDIRWVL